MAGQRTLSAAEVKRVQEYVEQRERTRFPDYIISVTVKKETDDNGNPIVNITRMNEAVISDFKP